MLKDTTALLRSTMDSPFRSVHEERTVCHMCVCHMCATDVLQRLTDDCEFSIDLAVELEVPSKRRAVAAREMVPPVPTSSDTTVEDQQWPLEARAQRGRAMASTWTDSCIPYVMLLV